jgi:uncharacterized protein
MLETVCVSNIELYQKHLSPLKGFGCARRIHTGRCSCSEFARRFVLKFGAVRARLILPARFRACAASHRALAMGERPESA